MNKIVLQNITVEGSLVKYKFSVNQEMKRFFNAETMFLQYNQAIQDTPLSILTIPFVNSMAGLSWLADAKLFVDEIDETYYYALKHIKLAYSELHGARLKGTFIPSIIRRNIINNNDHHLLLFGGGVDCFSSYLRNRDKVSGVVNIYGWAKDELDVSDVDVSDKKHTAAFAKQFGIISFHVTSNFASQFNLREIDKELSYKIVGTTYWYGFLHSMAFLSISVPIAWLNNFSNLMIASSFTKGREDVHCGSFITTDSEFKFASNGVTLHDGFELNRQEKVALIVNCQRESSIPYYVQACSFNDHNCCTCEKCFRTVIELIAENADPRDYGFNIEGSMFQHWNSVIDKDVALWGVSKESYYYNQTKMRILENYDNVQDKEFVDWFLSFDFDKAKRDGLWRYYRKNFFSIVKRKLKGRLHRKGECN